MRKLVTLALVLFSLGFFATSASANSFTLNGTFADGSTVVGLLGINITAGTVTTANLSYLGMTFGLVLNKPVIAGVGYHFDVFAGALNTTPAFSFLLPVNSLVGYTGGSICSDAAPCGIFVTGYFPTQTSLGLNLASGTLTSTPTPEPSSLILLGTGLLGLGPLVRRRLRSTS